MTSDETQILRRDLQEMLTHFTFDSINKKNPGRLDGSGSQVLDFGSGHDLTVRGFEPRLRVCAHSSEPGWDALSPSLCPSPQK